MSDSATDAYRNSVVGCECDCCNCVKEQRKKCPEFEYGKHIFRCPNVKRRGD